MPRCLAYHARSASGSRARRKTPPIPPTRSATHELPWPADELGEHVTRRTQLFEARILPLRRVRFGNGEERRRPDLPRHRLHPVDQRLDPGARGHDLAALEVDQAVGEAVANRAPKV